ncbi:MAG: PP2C family protein-serine/threonine phosphatase [Candidatus Rifleibacteriota bacterium]
MSQEMVFLLVDEILSSRILIISHVEKFGLALEKMLHHEGFDSISRVSGVSEAILFLRPFLSEDSFPVDLIVFEGGNLNEKSIDEIWKAKETFEILDIPMVVIGEASCSEDLIELIETGCVDYIQKPFEPINLVARFKTLLNLRQANRKLKKHQIELTNLTNQLEEKNRHLNSILEDIRFDLQLAGDLQRSFLPPANISGETIDFAFFYQPCETIGGDLINVIPISARHFVVYLLDVSGHGVSAALLAFAIHRHLSSEASQGLIKKKTGKLRPPAEVLQILNRDFLSHNEWFRYFTITYGIYDCKNRLFTYCRAGQTPLLLFKRNGNAHTVSHGSLPVGLSASAVFKEEHLHLSPGDRVYLYSDGLTEARCKDENFFGERRLIDGLQNFDQPDLQKQLNDFIENFFLNLDGVPPKDDIALLGMLIK